MAPRIRSLSLKGFRSYGAAGQTLNLPADLAIVWGPNSRGKTSLAEAFEFLLTGRIVRRELMASSQDEFSDALRNAHIATDTEVSVAARIIAVDGGAHEIRRILTTDYGKRQDCASRLEIDGAVAADADLEKFGIVLSQPPLSAPVLAQHTLSYIFSVRPQDRATYFKTLLEVTDLDQLRNDVGALANDLKPPAATALEKFDRCVTVTGLKVALEELARTLPVLAKFAEGLSDAACALINAAGEDAPAELADRLSSIEGLLVVRRGKTFPIRGFERVALAGWNSPGDDIWRRLETYVAERALIDAEVRRLAALFDEALKIPTIASITAPIDCPLCGTETALTPERVEVIRRYVEGTKEFKSAETAVRTALSQLLGSTASLASAIENALPLYLKTTAARRRGTGFTIDRIRRLLGEGAAEFVDPWLSTVRPLVRTAFAARRAAREVGTLVERQLEDLASLNPTTLKGAFEKLSGLRSSFADSLQAYGPQADVLVAALNAVLDAQSDTAGWQDFVDIARQPETLRTLLIERAARAVVASDLDAALKQIDAAKEQVLDDKFAEYSGLIQKWWERLRPDEPIFFAAVQPRKGAKRTIDFKAGLSPNPDRSAPKVRDVIAVFSQSQLHCLGLALFLARSEREGAGFIVLDDPVMSSDEDYRVHFNATVLSELLELPMQVVVLTQDHEAWEDIEIRYRHRGISIAQLFIETPAAGTIIENTSDRLLAKISRAKSLARGGHPDSRKECGIQLRDAGELFCKEILVANRQAKGDKVASLSDYDGKTLEWLCPHVDPLLIQDASHPGKLQAFRNTVNNACHDNAPPGTAEMTHACGEINFLQKQYLPR